MGTRVTSAVCLLAAVCGHSFAQEPTTTRPPLRPDNAGSQPHRVAITADDPGDGTRRFSVIVAPKVKGEYCEVEQGYLTVKDGDKLVCACFVRAETFPAGPGFTFTVAAANFDRSRLGFTVLTAPPAERKKLPSAAGWVGYEFTLKDFAQPPGKPAPGDKAPPPDQPAPKGPASSKVVVEKTSITFDPKTCTEGRGQFAWGLGSCAVKVLGRKDGHCVFEYTEEVEMGEATYLVRVPVDSGPVTVRIDRVTKRGSTFDWPVTSFPLDKAKLLRQGNPHVGWSVRVGDTDSFVKVHPAENRSEMAPQKGDKVKFRFALYDGPRFKDRLAGAPHGPTAEFVAGSDEVWPWLAIAMERMTVGDRVPVEVPVAVAEGAKEWLPKGSKATVLYLEVSLVSTGRGK